MQIANCRLQIANGIRLVGALFGLGEVVRPSNEDRRIHIAEFRNPIWDDQLQATARPFGVPDFTSTKRTRAGQRAIFRPVDEHCGALKEDVKQ
jgi:hypothetical protein